MLHGRTHLYEFTRDDGTEVCIEYKRTPYDPGNTYGPAENCYPPEGGNVEDWEVDNGKTVLTEAEAERAQDELDALPFEDDDDYDDYDDWRDSRIDDRLTGGADE
jgi:hypothetical protein